MWIARALILGALLGTAAAADVHAQSAESRLSWALTLQTTQELADGSSKIASLRITTKTLLLLVRQQLGPDFADAKLGLTVLRDLVDEDPDLLTDRLLVRADGALLPPLLLAEPLPGFPLAAALASERTSGDVVLSRKLLRQLGVSLAVGSAPLGSQLAGQLLGNTRAVAKRRGSDLLYASRVEQVLGSLTAALPGKDGELVTLAGVVTGSVRASAEKVSAF